LFKGIYLLHGVLSIETLKTAVVSFWEEPSAFFFSVDVGDFYHFCAVQYPEYLNESLRAVEQWVCEMR